MLCVVVLLEDLVADIGISLYLKPLPTQCRRWSSLSGLLLWQEQQGLLGRHDSLGSGMYLRCGIGVPVRYMFCRPYLLDLVRCNLLSGLYTPLGVVLHKTSILEYLVFVMHPTTGGPQKQHVLIDKLEAVNEAR